MPLLVKGTADVGEDSVKVIASEIIPLKDVRENLTKSVHFRITTPGLEKEQLHKLKEIVEGHRGNCEAFIHVVIPNRSETVISLPEEIRVKPCDGLLVDVEKVFGYNVVSFN